MGIEPSFQEFQDSLFSRASLTLERSVQSKEVNQKLDEDISLFLCRLSPYFLLKPAHKCLEWLLHRYDVKTRLKKIHSICTSCCSTKSNKEHTHSSYVLFELFRVSCSWYCPKFLALGPVKGKHIFPGKGAVEIFTNSFCAVIMQLLFGFYFLC